MNGDDKQLQPPSAIEPTEPSRFLTRDQILGADDRQFEEVDVPEWGGQVRVRGLTGTERDSWEASLLRQDKTGRNRPRMDYSDLRAKLVARSVVDDNGQRVFADRDVHELGGKSASALQRVFEVCQRLSRLTDEDVEELTGNSSGEQNGASGSGSPLISASP